MILHDSGRIIEPIFIFHFFLSIVIGRPGLERRDIVDNQQALISKALRHQLRQSHPTNHEDVYTGLMLLTPYVREINCQHRNLIVDFGKDQSTDLPPLHKEVFGNDDDD